MPNAFGGGKLFRPHRGSPFGVVSLCHIGSLAHPSYACKGFLEKVFSYQNPTPLRLPQSRPSVPASTGGGTLFISRPTRCNRI